MGEAFFLAVGTGMFGSLLWSAMSLLMLFGGIAVVLFAFGRFNFLGWHGDDQRRPAMLPHYPTASPRYAQVLRSS
jgi:nitric oxide reductase subunit B